MTPLSRLRQPVLFAAIAIAGLLIYATSSTSTRLVGAVETITSQVNDLMGVTAKHDREITERVINLPEDGQAWSTVFVWPEYREADQDSRRLAALFASEPRLQSLLAQTKSFHYTPADPLWRTRYAQQMGGATPQFWLIRPGPNPADGTAVYAVSGQALPTTGKDMADGIARNINRICPRPNPGPSPAPGPQPVTPAPQIPDISPPEPIDDPLPLWVWILPVLAAGGGALAEWKRSV